MRKTRSGLGTAALKAASRPVSGSGLPVMLLRRILRRSLLNRLLQSVPFELTLLQHPRCPCTTIKRIHTHAAAPHDSHDATSNAPADDVLGSLYSLPKTACTFFDALHSLAQEAFAQVVLDMDECLIHSVFPGTLGEYCRLQS